jgi:hypothetical protein
METTIYDKKGKPVAYVSDDHRGTIYLWDGEPVAYVYEDIHVFGLNGQHLGWLRDEIFYSEDGRRVGFTSSTCPVTVSKSPSKTKKRGAVETRPRWKSPPSPKFSLLVSDQDLGELLKQGGATFRLTEGAEESVKE